MENFIRELTYWSKTLFRKKQYIYFSAYYVFDIVLGNVRDTEEL